MRPGEFEILIPKTGHGGVSSVDLHFGATPGYVEMRKREPDGAGSLLFFSSSMKIQLTQGSFIRAVRAICRLSLGCCFGAAASLAQNNIREGFGSMAGANIFHPNGQYFDQVLLTGPNVTVTADPGQVVRVSFLDLNDDITQVEFAGSGSVTIELESATYQGPAPAAKYIQPDVAYVKGRATVRVRAAAADTFVSVFSVGRDNAINKGLFPEGMIYDAMADIRLLDIEGAELGAVLTGNVRFSGESGATGVHAPGTAVRYRVVVGEINASGEAVPVLRIGVGSQLVQDDGAVLVAGGRLEQGNGSPIDVGSSSGQPMSRLNAVAGTRSSGEWVPASFILAELGSRLPGSVAVNGVPRQTRGFVPASFDALWEEMGGDAIDFGEGVRVTFSGGNAGSYSMAGEFFVEGERVNATLTGNYSYAVAGTNQNQMTFTLRFDRIVMSWASGSFNNTVRELANQSGEALPVSVSAVANFESGTTGTATMTVTLTSGVRDSFFTEFDAENDLDFGFF